MAVMLIFPIIQWIDKDEMASDILQWQETKQKIESIYYEPEQEVDIFSYVDELENQGQTEELEVEWLFDCHPYRYPFNACCNAFIKG